MCFPVNVEKHLAPILPSSWMNNFAWHYSEVAFHRLLQNKSFFKFRNIQRKTPALESDLKAHNLIKERLKHRYFPVNI